MQWSNLLSTRRVGPQPARTHGDSRREFDVDHDRIVFSRAFRRMQDKTQVHPLESNDHVRRRLTHSVEVGSVGRSLGTTAAELLHDKGHIETDPRDVGHLVQAAALAHDIGNPPFGHSGEEAIRDWFQGRVAQELGVFDGVEEPHVSDLRGFEGNAHGFRILTTLESYAHEGGMRLTAATLGCFTKYPYGSTDARAFPSRKFGFFESERKLVEELAEILGLLEQPGGGWCRHPLVYLVEAADDICYALADLEDGVELGVVDFLEVEALLRHFVPRTSAYPDIKEKSRKLEMLRSYAIRTVVPDAARAFAEAEASLLAGAFEGELLDRIESGKAIREAQKFAREAVFSHPRKVYTEIGAFETLGGLLSAFVRATLDAQAHHVDGARMPMQSRHLLELMGKRAPRPDMPRHQALRLVTDFVAGTTDGYASTLFSRVRGRTRSFD